MKNKKDRKNTWYDLLQLIFFHPRIEIEDLTGVLKFLQILFHIFHSVFHVESVIARFCRNIFQPIYIIKRNVLLFQGIVLHSRTLLRQRYPIPSYRRKFVGP